MPVALLTVLAAIVAATVYLFSKTWLPALASSGGAGMDHQLTLNLVLLGIVFCATQMALGVFIWKYREQSKPPESPVGAQPDMRVELAWLTLAAALFLGLNIAGAVIWPQAVTPAVLEKRPLRVEVTGMQFRWYFRYPGADGNFGRTRPELVDAAEGNPLGIDRSDPDAADDLVTTSLTLPADRDVELILRAQDVIHSFFVPALRVKQDAVPGQAIVIHLSGVMPGTYYITCAQLCGMGHYQMGAILNVIPEEQYRSWLAGNAPALARR